MPSSSVSKHPTGRIRRLKSREFRRPLRGLPSLTWAAELMFLLPRGNHLSKELKYNEPLESKPIARNEGLQCPAMDLAGTVGNFLQLHRLRQSPRLRPGRVEPHAPSSGLVFCGTARPVCLHRSL